MHRTIRLFSMAAKPHSAGTRAHVFVALLDDPSGMGRRGWIAVERERPRACRAVTATAEGVTISMKSVSACEAGMVSRTVSRVSLSDKAIRGISSCSPRRSFRG